MSSIPYISSGDCFFLLYGDQDSYLIDVSIPTEWNVDGLPDEDSFEGFLFKLAIRNEEGTAIPNFIEEFNSLEIPMDSNIYFICKSGGRSILAANLVANEGYKSLFNVEDGFTLGWKPKGLPSAEYYSETEIIFSKSLSKS
jgi:Rhodanese-related sulfurtransferase